mgnify:FL=1
MNKLKYLGYSIVFQEVPNEVTLAINISGCPHRCEGCHSKYLWEYEGNYILDDLTDLIEKYKGLITCVCFMGGDQNWIELMQLAHIVDYYGLHVALYSGFPSRLSLYNVAQCFDYVKVGAYDSSLGGLTSKTTNQRMYRQINKPSNIWEDITYKFWTDEK